MTALFYKGEDVTITFTSATDMSAYTKVVKFFTPLSAIKEATVTAVDTKTFTAKMTSANTADLTTGSLNIVVELTLSGNKMISKTIQCKLADAYVDGSEREATDLTADIVFANNQTININILGSSFAAEAAVSAASALTSRNEAETFKTAAQTAKTGAETAQTGAQTAKTGAETAKTGAETARDTAIATVANRLESTNIVVAEAITFSKIAEINTTDKPFNANAKITLSGRMRMVDCNLSIRVQSDGVFFYAITERDQDITYVDLSNSTELIFTQKYIGGTTYISVYVKKTNTGVSALLTITNQLSGVNTKAFVPVTQANINAIPSDEIVLTTKKIVTNVTTDTITANLLNEGIKSNAKFSALTDKYFLSDNIIVGYHGDDHIVVPSAEWRTIEMPATAGKLYALQLNGNLVGAVRYRFFDSNNTLLLKISDVKATSPANTAKLCASINITGSFDIPQHSLSNVVKYLLGVYDDGARITAIETVNTNQQTAINTNATEIASIKTVNTNQQATIDTNITKIAAIEAINTTQQTAISTHQNGIDILNTTKSDTITSVLFSAAILTGYYDDSHILQSADTWRSTVINVTTWKSFEVINGFIAPKNARIRFFNKENLMLLKVTGTKGIVPAGSYEMQISVPVSGTWGEIPVPHTLSEVPNYKIYNNKYDYKILLTGASFAAEGNMWFPYACQRLNAFPINRAIGATSIFHTANMMYNGSYLFPVDNLIKTMSLYTTAELEDIDALVIMHVHNENVADTYGILQDYTQYVIDPYSPLTYAQSFDYVLKKYMADCYAKKTEVGSKYYGLKYGKPANIILCTHWHDARTIYNAAVRVLTSKWEIPLVEFDKNIGFSKEVLHPSGVQTSLIYSVDGDPGMQTIDGVVYGFHPILDSPLQQRMGNITAQVIKRIL